MRTGILQQKTTKLNLQGRFRVLAVYFLGGISGVLGAACLHPDLVVGASAGGYSLLLSNVADLMLVNILVLIDAVGCKWIL